MLESRINALELRRQRWEPLWKEAMEFCFPARLFDPVDDQNSDKRPKVNFNNRAALDVGIASAGFQGYTANRRSQWMKLQFENIELMKQYGVADWLEKCERTMYAVFSRSGLYEALGEAVPDGHVIGTAVIYTEDLGNGRISYQTRHPLAVWISEDSRGEVDTVLEDVPMNNRAIEMRFGKEALSDAMREASEKRPYEVTTVRHIAMPMDKDFMKYARNPVHEKMGYCSVWYDQPGRRVLDVGGYWEMPFSVWRYSKNAGEEYGRAKAHAALGDVMAGNQMTRSRIKLGNLIAEPALLVDEGLEGVDTILPNQHIYRENRDDTIEPVALGANYPITKDNEERQDALIDAHFDIPIYQMLQNMERQMTAREVIERTGEKAAILGPTTGRYEREMLHTIIRRTFNLLYRSGKLPKAPQAVMDAGAEAALKIEFLGFLAQLQQRYYQTTGINATLAYAKAVMEMFPTSGDWVDSDNLMVEGMESSGSPASVVREKEDVDRIRQARLDAQAQAAQEQQQAMVQQDMVQNADKLGKKPESGSPLENMGKAAAAQAGAA
jgi:hypothetical protein